MLFCLLPLIVSCGKQEVVRTEVRMVGIPEGLLPDCRIPAWRGGSFRDVILLAEERRSALVECNIRIDEARRYQRRVLEEQE